MSNDTQNTQSVKRCSQGDNCVHPSGPVLPLTEFYTRNNGKPHAKCKECAKVYQKRHWNQNKRNYKSNPQTWRKSEQDAVNYLRSHGIYATSGIASEWTWVDVVAWGCVRIEVKTSNNLNGDRYHFGLSPKNHKNWHKNDLLMLVCNTPNGKTYHLFERDNPVFYNADGTHKKSIMYIPNPQHSRKSNHALTREIMSTAQNRIELINDCRLSWEYHTRKEQA